MMNSRFCCRGLISVGVAVAALPALAAELQQVVESATGVRAKTLENGVVRIGWVRDEVPVTISGMKLKPAAGLGSWAAFKPSDDGALVAGDTVVFEDEITPAMDTAFANGLRVTALHNHFIFDAPPVYFMHIAGTGKPERLASAVDAVWDAIKAVREATPQPQRRLPEAMPDLEGNFDESALTAILGSEPERTDSVVKYTLPRQGELAGLPVGGPMGLSSWAAFSGSQDRALVDGDFIMTADEVQPVMHALRDHDIHLVALHNHMIRDEPQFFFLHYLGVGPAEDLAAGIKAALELE